MIPLEYTLQVTPGTALAALRALSSAAASALLSACSRLTVMVDILVILDPGGQGPTFAGPPPMLW